MKLVPIDSATHPALPIIKGLYEQSFPVNERRFWNDLMKIIGEPSVTFSAIETEEGCIGFIIYWKLPLFTYIEHIAIDEHQRGKGYGKVVIEQLIASSSKSLILETELPTTEVAERRVTFYQKQGFKIAPHRYTHPPYRKGEEPVPMLLMSVPLISSEHDFIKITTVIKKEVYEKFY